MIWVTGTPAVLHDEVWLGFFVMGYADYFHTVVVGGKVVLELPLALFLHLAEGNRLVNVGCA